MVMAFEILIEIKEEYFRRMDGRAENLEQSVHHSWRYFAPENLAYGMSETNCDRPHIFVYIYTDREREEEKRERERALWRRTRRMSTLSSIRLSIFMSSRSCDRTDWSQNTMDSRYNMSLFR